MNTKKKFLSVITAFATAVSILPTALFGGTVLAADTQTATEQDVTVVSETAEETEEAEVIYEFEDSWCGLKYTITSDGVLTVSDNPEIGNTNDTYLWVSANSSYMMPEVTVFNQQIYLEGYDEIVTTIKFTDDVNYIPDYIFAQSFCGYEDYDIKGYSQGLNKFPNLETVILSNTSQLGNDCFYGLEIENFIVPAQYSKKIYYGVLYYFDINNLYIYNPECNIADSETTFKAVDTIYGYENSTAYDYAEKYGRTFYAFDSDEPLLTAPAVTTTITAANTTTTTTTTTTTKITTTSTLQNFVDVTSLSQTTTLSSDVIISTVISVIPLETTAVSNISGTYENLSYIQHEDHIEIVDCDETVTEVIIPDEINGLPVTIIGDSAFSKCSIEDIVIPENITYIGYNAFYSCYPLNSITFESRNCKIVTAYNNGWADTFVNSFYHSSSSCFTPDYTGTFYVYEDSTAHAYAESHYLNFSIIEESAVTTAITTTQTTTTTTTAVSLPQTSPTITSKITTSPCGNGDGIVTSAPPKSTATTTTTSMTIITSFLPVTMITSQTTQLSLAGWYITSVYVDMEAENIQIDKSGQTAEMTLTVCSQEGTVTPELPEGIKLTKVVDTEGTEYAVNDDGTFDTNGTDVILTLEIDESVQNGEYKLSFAFRGDEYVDTSTSTVLGGIHYIYVCTESDGGILTIGEPAVTTTAATTTTRTSGVIIITVTSKITTSPCGNGDGIVTSATTKSTKTTTTVSTSISLQTSVTVMTYIVERGGYFTIDNYPDKLSYAIGEELDLSGLEMTIKYYPGGFTANPNNIYYYTAVENVNPLDYPDLFVVDTSAFDNTKCGEYTITITPTEECKTSYYTFVAGKTFTVTVTEPDVTTTELTTSSATETTVTTSTTTATQSVVTGDADEDNELTVRDCAYIAIMIAEGKTDMLTKTADFNGDGIVNVRDAAAIARKLAEKL